MTYYAIYRSLFIDYDVITDVNTYISPLLIKETINHVSLLFRVIET